MNLFKRKSLSNLLEQLNDKQEIKLKRSLTKWSLIALGIGTIVGAGLFVRTAQAAALGAGPGVIFSFMIAAFGCLFTGLCYAELAAMIPIAGSAYTYTYVALGEFMAWLIGWALIQEYALGATMLPIAWGEYVNNLLGNAIPYQWIHSPFERLVQTVNEHGQSVITSVKYFQVKPTDIILQTGYLNLPAVFILGLITLLLIKGTSESSLFNNVMVVIKIGIVFLFIILGWQYINPANHTPFLVPQNVTSEHTDFFHYGWGGVLFGSAYVFFAFIGFDGVSTAAQEAKNPQKDVPIGIIGSLIICTLLYIVFGFVLTGIANYKEFLNVGKEASMAYVIATYMGKYVWLKTLISVAILAGFTTVILMMLYAQSRIFFVMAKDGFLPKALSHIHPKYYTPYKATIAVFIFTSVLASVLPIDLAGDLSSFGTLLAFMIVSVAVWVMRFTHPNVHRPFRVKFLPFVSILGILVCGGMLYALDTRTHLVSLSWITLGIIIYFTYSRFKINTN